MADKYISQIKMPGDTTPYKVKDTYAHDNIKNLLNQVIIFDCGTATTVMDTQEKK